MSNAGADRIDARLTGLENTVEQMDKRLDELNDRMNERFNTLDSQIEQNREEIRGGRGEIGELRTEFRRWFLVFFAALSLVFTIVSVVVQVAV